MGRVSDREPDIATTDRGQLSRAIARPRLDDRCDDRLGQQLVTRGRERRQQPGLVAEMVRWRAMGDSGPARHISQRDAGDTALGDGAINRRQQRGRQVTMVVGHGPS